MDSDDDFMSAMSSEVEDNDDSFDEEFDDYDEAPDPDFDLVTSESCPPANDSACKVYEASELRRLQQDEIEEGSMILNLPNEDVAILMRHFRWNKERLIEDYMERPRKVLDDAGLFGSITGRAKIEVDPDFICDICFDEENSLNSYKMRCGHRYCVKCYCYYLSHKVCGEGEAARIQCPAEGCGRIVDSLSLQLLVTPDIRDKYQQLLNRTYVDDKEYIKWCPAPDCQHAVECRIKKRDLDKIVPTVACRCGMRFCFGCNLTDHQPTPCRLVKRWLKKCADDSETANWISANTKECPKCNSTIEKNGGCNHMTCRPCKYEFCWSCMGVWAEHGTSWYNCSRYEEKSGTHARDAQAKSRLTLERYLHYYNRWANHEQSARLEKDSYLRTDKKMTQVQTASGLSWIEVQYLQSASQSLQTCRQTLKWTYAFAFYLEKNNLTHIFENNQMDLELAVEALSEMFEKSAHELSSPKLKVDIMDKTTYCNKRRIILLEYTADNLARGRWVFNADGASPSPACPS